MPRKYQPPPSIHPENDPVSPEQEKIIVTADTPSKRVEMIREERNMSKAAFAKSIGMTPTGYQTMIGRDSVQESVAIATEYRHGFCSKWILTGDGQIRTDQWELLRGEIEDSFLRDLNVYLSQKLKRTVPMIRNKDKNERQFR
jgi:DNA-binding XRE family transcriptional regulator